MNYIILILISLLLSGCFLDSGETEKIGSQKNPLKLVFVPSDDEGLIEESARHLVDFLQKDISKRLYNSQTGFYIRSAVPNNYIAVVEAIGSARADVAIMNTYGYYILKAKRKYEAEAILTVQRGDGETSYKSQFLVLRDSPLKSIQDIKGKRIAYSDPSSTSGYVVPAVYLDQNGVSPSEKVFAGKHSNVVMMVLQGQVDVGATYYFPPISNGEPRDARSRVLTQYPDVYGKTRVLSYSHSIPNAPWIIRKGLYHDSVWYERVKRAFQDAVLEYSKTPEGKKRLEDNWGITGLKKASDREFEGVIKTYKHAEKLTTQ